MGGKLPPSPPPLLRHIPSLHSPIVIYEFSFCFLFLFLFLFFIACKKGAIRKFWAGARFHAECQLANTANGARKFFNAHKHTHTYTHTHMCVLFGQSCQAAGKQALITKFAQLLDMSSLKWLPNYGRSWLRIVSRRRLIDRVVKCSGGEKCLG